MSGSVDSALRLAGLVADGAEPRVVGSGFQFTEGPIWQPHDGCLLFSDIPAARRLRYDGLACGVALEPTMMANGMTLDADLNLLVCEHSTSTLSRFAGGVREVIASHFEGRQLNSPNDVIVANDGAIWFTDPTYGRMEGFGVARASELGFQGVYRIPPGSRTVELAVERELFSQPNGLCFSPDETRLYINDTEQANIRVFDVQGGELGNMRVFAAGITDPRRPGAPDGMKCDAAGNIWCTGPNGIWIYAPDGKRIGEVAVPEFAANLHWGGDDWRTLFITASTSLYALDVAVGPHAEPFMAGFL